jgi:hypothetical protein
VTTPLSETVARLWALLAKATAGPWTYSRSSQTIIQTAHLTRDAWTIPRSDEDMELIVALRNAAPALLDAAERVEALEQLLRDAEANEGMGESEAIHQARRAEAAEARLAQVEGALRWALPLAREYLEYWNWPNGRIDREQYEKARAPLTPPTKETP